MPRKSVAGPRPSFMPSIAVVAERGQVLVRKRARLPGIGEGAADLGAVALDDVRKLLGRRARCGAGPATSSRRRSDPAAASDPTAAHLAAQRMAW